MKTRSSFLTLSWRNVALTLFLAGCLLAGMAARAAETPKPSPGEPPPESLQVGHVKKLDLVIKDGQFTNASGQKQEATVENLVDYARTKFHKNIVLSPGVGGIVISDLRLEAADIDGFARALQVASGMTVGVGKVQDGELGVWAVTGRDQSPRRVEVFNLTTYLALASPGGKETREKLEQLQRIILETLHQLKQ